MSSTNLAAVFAAKKILRRELKRKLKELTVTVKQTESESVATKILGHPKYKASQNVCGRLLFQMQIFLNAVSDLFFHLFTVVLLTFFQCTLRCPRRSAQRE